MVQICNFTYAFHRCVPSYVFLTLYILNHNADIHTFSGDASSYVCYLESKSNVLESAKLTTEC